MAFDGLFLTAITRELNQKLSESRCDKISQPEKDEIVLSFRSRTGAYKVLMTSATDSARTHLTEIGKQNPMQAPLFTMVLRKHIQGGRLRSVTQYQGDRIITFEFESTDELGFHSVYLLICEMMGKHSNIVLVRARDMKIIDCIKHVSHDMNTYRLLLPGAEYISPPAQNKLDPQADFELDLAGELTLIKEPGFFMKAFTGISKKTSAGLSRRFVNSLLPSDGPMEKLSKIRRIMEAALRTETFYCLLKEGYPEELSLLPPDETDREQFDEIVEFASPSAALEYYFLSKDKTIRVKERSQEILKVVSLNLERVEKKVAIFTGVINDAQVKDDLLIRGELLKANLYSIANGADKAAVTNYYSPEAAMVEIELDPHKTPSENMQSYFRRYNKMKRAEEYAKEQLLLANEELSYLNSVAESIMKSEDPSDISEIRNELIVAGYIKYRSGKKKKDSPSKPMQFISTEGIPIFVGKNNNQNDFLTTKLAASDDTWLHAKGYPGSHVIIKGKKFNEETLLEAANLAAHYSKAAGGTKVPVDYTLVRHVKKPNGAKPGMVTYTTNKTIYIDPDSPRIQRV